MKKLEKEIANSDLLGQLWAGTNGHPDDGIMLQIERDDHCDKLECEQLAQNGYP